jgi:hypothetical protein
LVEELVDVEVDIRFADDRLAIREARADRDAQTQRASLEGEERDDPPAVFDNRDTRFGSSTTHCEGELRREKGTVQVRAPGPDRAPPIEFAAAQILREADGRLHADTADD